MATVLGAMLPNSKFRLSEFDCLDTQPGAIFVCTIVFLDNKDLVLYTKIAPYFKVLAFEGLPCLVAFSRFLFARDTFR